MEWLETIRTMLPASSGNVLITVGIAIVAIGIAWGMSRGVAQISQRILLPWRGVIMTSLQFLVLVGAAMAIAVLIGMTEATVFAAIAVVFLIGSAFYSDRLLPQPINSAMQLSRNPANDAETMIVKSSPQDIVVEESTAVQPSGSIVQTMSDTQHKRLPQDWPSARATQPELLYESKIRSLRKRRVLGKQTVKGLRLSNGGRSM